MVVEGKRQRGHDGPGIIQCWSIKEGSFLSPSFFESVVFRLLGNSISMHGNINMNIIFFHISVINNESRVHIHIYICTLLHVIAIIMISIYIAILILVFIQRLLILALYLSTSPLHCSRGQNAYSPSLATACWWIQDHAKMLCPSLPQIVVDLLAQKTEDGWYLEAHPKLILFAQVLLRPPIANYVGHAL